MKILKIFGFVVGVHVFALVLIFGNPGCSSSTKPVAPVLADTAAPAPGMSTQNSSTAVAPAPAASSSTGSAPISFNPDAPALPAAGTSSASSGGVRFTPTRPGTPAAGTLITEPVSDVTPTTTYTVKSGDSLWTIAKKHNLSVAQLTAANSLPASTNLKPGQKLLIPGKTPSTTAASAAPVPALKSAETAAAPRSATSASSGTIKHVVKSGETLGEIARRYGVKARDIMAANYISDPAKIQAGAELVIPGWDSATKGSKAGTSKSSTTSTTPAATKPATTTKAAPVTPPPTIDVESTPAPAQPSPQVPVIRIDEGPSPVVPAPKGP